MEDLKNEQHHKIADYDLNPEPEKKTGVTNGYFIMIAIAAFAITTAFVSFVVILIMDTFLRWD